MIDDNNLITVNGDMYVHVKEKWFILLEIKDQKSCESLTRILLVNASITPVIDSLNKLKNLKKKK